VSEPTLAPNDDPPPEPAAQPTTTTKRTWLVTSIAIAAVLLVMAVVAGVLVARGLLLATADTDSTELQPIETNEPADTDIEEPSGPQTPEPLTAEVGSVANPYPAGYTMILSDTSSNVEVFSLMQRPAESTALAEDVPVEPTTDGMRVVAIDFAVVGLDPAVAGIDMAMEAGLWQIADQDGTGYSPLFTQVLTDPTVPMTDGTIWGGRNFYEVPSSATTPYVPVYTSYVALQ
jgi:hypothetical protein